MTVTNCHGCGLPTNAAATTTVTGSNSLQQGYNYPEPLGRQQQYLWFTSAAAVTIGMGCPAVTFAGTYSQFTERTTMYHTGYDGSRMELAAISENYVKIYVNNGGRAAMLYPTSLSSTIYYSLCTVASNGTETCPTYIALGTFYPTDNPFILITDLEDVRAPVHPHVFPRPRHPSIHPIPSRQLCPSAARKPLWPNPQLFPGSVFVRLADVLMFGCGFGRPTALQPVH